MHDIETYRRLQALRDGKCARLPQQVVHLPADPTRVQVLAQVGRHADELEVGIGEW
jgi:hypothetical protein